MKKGWLVFGIVTALLVAIIAGTAGSYNSLVRLETRVEAQWAQVENQLQRRADLIPNLVAVVQGYADHEQEVFTAVAEARRQLLGADLPGEQIEASQGLDTALGRLLAISENYPELKADTSFIRLQDELAGTENRIAVERMRYNESVQEWNQTIQQFPAVLLANALGKESMRFFQLAEGADDVPRVQF